MQRSSEIQLPNNIGADKFQTTFFIQYRSHPYNQTARAPFFPNNRFTKPNANCLSVSGKQSSPIQHSCKLAAFRPSSGL